MAHTAELIAVGTEILLGNIANTDAQYLSEKLNAIGVNVFWHTVVGDNPHRLRDALNIARQRADIIITTGGLGPTYDDLTKQTICETFGRTLSLREDLLAELKAYMERGGRKMTLNNLQQAMMPENCTVFPNPVGTAPGCAFECDGVHVLMLPGPPHECKTMTDQQAIPYLKSLSSETLVYHDIKCFNIGESTLESMLHDRMVAMTNPTLATYAKPSESFVRAAAKAGSVEEAEAMLVPVIEEVKAVMGDHFYGVDDASLQACCMKLLKDKNLTLATAESCTGGQIAQWITDMPGSSAVFRGGVVSYWTEVKAAVLGVPQDILDEHGAVSEPTARAMAEGARRLTGADIAISATGVAGPDSDDRGNPVGLVFLGLATPDGTYCRRLELGKRRRDLVRHRACSFAFDMIRRYLSGLDPEAS